MDPRRTTEPDAPHSRSDEAYDGFGPDSDFDYGPPPPRRRSSGVDFAVFFVLLDAVRRAVPRELQHQLTSFIREALLTLRSLIDWYLERLERPPSEPRVEDIPID